MIMKMNVENFKSTLGAIKELKRILNRNLTDDELAELITKGWVEFCKKRNLSDVKIHVIMQMRELLSRYAEGNSEVPNYYASPETIDFIKALNEHYAFPEPKGNMHEESLEEDINTLGGFCANSIEDEFKIKLKNLFEEYNIFNKQERECKCAKTSQDDIDILIERLKEGDELEVEDNVKSQILKRLYDNEDSFHITTIGNKMSLKIC